MTSNIVLEKFDGSESGPLALNWVAKFLQWAHFYELSEIKTACSFPFHLEKHVNN